MMCIVYYVYFAPLPCVREVDDADMMKKIDQQK